MSEIKDVCDNCGAYLFDTDSPCYECGHVNVDDRECWMTHDTDAYDSGWSPV